MFIVWTHTHKKYKTYTFVKKKKGKKKKKIVPMVENLSFLWGSFFTHLHTHTHTSTPYTRQILSHSIHTIANIVESDVKKRNK